MLHDKNAKDGQISRRYSRYGTYCHVGSSNSTLPRTALITSHTPPTPLSSALSSPFHPAHPELIAAHHADFERNLCLNVDADGAPPEVPREKQMSQPPILRNSPLYDEIQTAIDLTSKVRAVCVLGVGCWELCVGSWCCCWLLLLVVVRCWL
jgi:hypothetical protein